MKTFDSAIHDQIEDLEFALLNNIDDKVRGIISGKHPSDIALLIQYLSPSVRQIFIEKFYSFISPAVIAELHDSLREEAFSKMNPNQLAEVFRDLESDDALEIFEDLDDVQQGIVLRSISKKDRIALQSTLSFPEDSAARLMQNEVPSVRSSWSVKQAINYVKYTEDKFDFVGEIFVVDNEHKLVGSVSMYTLIKNDSDVIIADLMIKNTVSGDVTMDQEAVALMFKKYSLLCLPVTDENNRLVGMITADDVLEVVEQEAKEDYVGMRGVDESDFYAPIITTGFSRLRWLLITAISSFVSSFVISRFDYVISQNVYLTVLMPVVAAMGGAYGLQVNTVIIRAIAMRELISKNSMRTIIKETAIASINGVFFSISLGFVSFIWLEDLLLSTVLFCGILFNMVWAGVVGVLYPIFLNKINLDPALSAGPLVGMSTDIMGFVIFLSIAALVLL